MQEINGIIYADIPTGPRVTAVQPLPDNELLLTFNNGEQRIFDTKPILHLRMFKPLASQELFNTVRVCFGTVAWGRTIDYCPDRLYEQSVPIAPPNVLDYPQKMSKK